METLFFVLQIGLIYGIAGLAVRMILSVSGGGFDLFVAISALISAEIGIAVANFWQADSISEVLLACCIGILSAGLIGYLWSVLISLSKLRKSPALAIFIGSFGALMFIMGSVGVLRGPGLRTFENISGQTIDFLNMYVGIGIFSGLTLTGMAILISLAFLKLPIGYALRLYTINPFLSLEIGINKDRVRQLGTIFTGFLAGVAGCAMALTGGSTPELGMKLFLYGIGAALLFESRELFYPLISGFILGAMQVGIQLYLAPAWSESIMFAVIVTVLILRGTSREVSGVR
ncbi:ABC transporter permease subunit [Nitrosomonas marina]|uniref:Amino acid/amide ABC transporter membrane protein 1, HAAT family n=1 Tax=Nitrosomonas marina TaxID=917 RepID=A0A1H8G319_9PROT|nr:hypothetical protein [Nitrosomonas marina]SEN38362.1 amino acid/amide ABC transporter membrane protein 1, HAAT family [Nitrosomonas marina]